MSSSQKSFLFAFIMCLVCGFLLTAAAMGLKPIQDDNKKVDQQKNILKALAVIGSEEKVTKAIVKDLYNKNISEMWLNQQGDLNQEKLNIEDLKIFILKEGNKVKSYAFPFKAYGLWSWMYGYFAIDSDGDTVKGFTVYQHAETPGLGGECEKPWFQNQFIGKKITNKNNEFVSIGVVKGKVADKVKPEEQMNYVDGMSGATITSQGLEKYLKEDIQKYEVFSKKMRNL